MGHSHTQVASQNGCTLGVNENFRLAAVDALLGLLHSGKCGFSKSVLVVRTEENMVTNGSQVGQPV